jgi:uncharacterized membrane protein (UPF0127 family)
MKKISCKTKNGKVISNEIYLADSFFQRLIGLMFKPYEEAISILIKPTQSIHTCFMRFNIDVIFLDKTDTIIKIIRNMKPWRVTAFYMQASKVLEMPAGDLPQNISIGEQLEFQYV